MDSITEMFGMGKKNKAKADKEAAKADKEAAKADKEPAKAGKEPAKAGKEPAKAGRKPAKSKLKIAKGLLRHKAPKLTAIECMTDSNFARHRKLAGIVRLRDRKKVYTRCKHIARKIIADIVMPSVHLLQHTRKMTLTPQIILHVANSQGRRIYWTDEDEHVPVAGYNDKTVKKAKKKEAAPVASDSGL